MKITSFNPLILTRDADAAIALFEALGFEQQHSITIDESGKDIKNVRMKDANGFCVDIAKSPDVPQDITMIRINVDDFDEAYKWLQSKGFTNPVSSDHVVETRTNRTACMISPSGFAFSICQHIK